MGATPGGELGGTWAAPTVDAIHSGSAHPTEQAPSTADYLVGTAQAGLSAEIVVGATPGGELGGTWAAPTVDAIHSGSAHPTGGTPAVVLSTAAAAGVSANFLRVDDTLAVFDATLPTAEAFGDTGLATNGAAIAARRDHRLTPDQGGAAVGLRAWPVSADDDDDSVGPFIGAVLAVAPEESDG